ncbi:MAG: FAD-dependent oxidoreductase [Candidatus Jordarchaeales archaeon]
MTKIVIIGAGAAGTTAGIWARKTDRKAEITLVTKEKYPEYSRCGLPYTISKYIPEFTNLITHDAGWYSSFGKMNLLLETEATDIDVSNRTVTVKDLRSKEEKKLEYDALVIATGSRPAFPPIKGIEGKKNVYSLRTIDDAMAIHEAAKKGKKCVVIGAGLIGVETTEALVELGVDVTLVEFLPSVLPLMVDADMSDMVENALKEHGVKIYTNTAVTELIGEDKAEKAVLKDRTTGEEEVIPTDFVVVSAGVRPNTELAVKAGVALGSTKYIKVDSRARTNVEGIYAAGDCTEYVDFVTGQPIAVGMGTIAVRQGKVAGINAAGGDAEMPKGILLTRITKVFGVEVAAVGPLTETLEKAGLKPIVGKMTYSSKPEYMPGGKPLKIKMMADEKGRILGAQIVGYEDIHQKINIIAAAMQANMNVEQLEWLETCYAPISCPTWSEITLVAEVIARKIKKK